MPAFLPDTAVVRSDLLDYYAEVQRFDGRISRGCSTRSNAVEKLDNTIVVVTSDNGMPFPREGDAVRLRLRHCRWQSAGLRGSRPEGQTVDAFVELTDLAPTLLEAAGVAAPSGMTGASLLPLLAGKAAAAGRDGRYSERERHTIISVAI